MRFASPPAAVRLPSVLPLLGVSLLPALLVLAMVCFALSREEQSVGPRGLTWNMYFSSLHAASGARPGICTFKTRVMAYALHLVFPSPSAGQAGAYRLE